jgi:arylsulfatase
MTTQNKPNVLLILNDDMGYSDLGCYGGEVRTPNLDRLAAGGLRFSQFYNTARCSPSRASLLTGLHPHQTGIGILTEPTGPEAYAGNLNKRCVTIAEVLKTAGYRTYLSGKWHVTSSITEPSDSWPLQRGFDAFYGTIIGAGSFYDPNTLTRGNDNIEHEPKEDPSFFYTDAITSQAVDYIDTHMRDHGDKPFFTYVGFTAPHWPLHARDEDIARYKGRFDEGWDTLREKRLERLVRSGILDKQWQLSPRDPTQPPWSSADDKAWLARCMEVYAAQIDRMDQGIGRILAALERNGIADDTLIVFLADNGACAEDIPDNLPQGLLSDKLGIARNRTRDGRPVRFGNDASIMPGPEDTYQSYGVAWANLSNTPFRLYKHWVHEGGISTPLIFHWPKGIAARNEIRHNPGYLPDIMATLCDICGAQYPSQFPGRDVLPLEGRSLKPAFTEDGVVRGPMFWEHEGNCAMRDGPWKLVRKHPGDWELYDMEADRTELHDLAAREPARVAAMAKAWDAWAARCGVLDRDEVIKVMRAKGFERRFYSIEDA